MALHYAVAGSCYTPENNWLRCVLTPSDCVEEDSVFGARPEADAPVCVVADLPSWRCGNVCVGHPDACPEPAFTNIMCSLGEDKETNTPTQYGSCHIDDDNTGWTKFGSNFIGQGILMQYCALRKADCLVEDEQLYTFHQADPSCTCDKVRTGACFDPLTDDHYCAADASICASGEVFRGVLDLEFNQDATCFLCKPSEDRGAIDDLPAPDDTPSDTDPAPTDPAPSAENTVDVVRPGACMRETGAVCSFGDCPEGVTFLSPRQLENLGGRRHECLSSIMEMELGRCNGDRDDNVCTSHFSACVVPGDFYRDSDCGMVEDAEKGNRYEETQFGACIGATGWTPNSFCAWSDNECTSDDMVWVKAADDSFHCGCDQVRTGACVSNVDSYCAVSEAACIGGYEYTPVRDLLDIYQKVCYLCEPLDAAPVAGVPGATPVAPPTEEDVVVPITASPVATNEEPPAMPPAVVAPPEEEPPVVQPVSPPISPPVAPTPRVPEQQTFDDDLIAEEREVGLIVLFALLSFVAACCVLGWACCCRRKSAAAKEAAVAADLSLQNGESETEPEII